MIFLLLFFVSFDLFSQQVYDSPRDLLTANNKSTFQEFNLGINASYQTINSDGIILIPNTDNPTSGKKDLLDFELINFGLNFKYYWGKDNKKYGVSLNSDFGTSNFNSTNQLLIYDINSGNETSEIAKTNFDLLLININSKFHYFIWGNYMELSIGPQLSIIDIDFNQERENSDFEKNGNFAGNLSSSEIISIQSGLNFYYQIWKLDLGIGINYSFPLNNAELKFQNDNGNWDVNSIYIDNVIKLTNFSWVLSISYPIKLSN